MSEQLETLLGEMEALAKWTLDHWGPSSAPFQAAEPVPALVQALRYLLESSHGTMLLAGSVGRGDTSDQKLRAIHDVTSKYPDKVISILSGEKP